MNAFLTLQEAVRTQLQLHSDLNQVAILIEDKGDIEAGIEAALARSGVMANTSGAVGVAILIVTPSGNAGAGMGHRPLIDIRVRVAVFENPVINRATGGVGLTSLDLLDRVIKQLHGWQPHPGASPAMFSAFDSDADDTGNLAYFADFNLTRTLT